MRIKAGNVETGDRDMVVVSGASVSDDGPGGVIRLMITGGGGGDHIDTKGFRSINAPAYGAVQDGSTDCTAAVAACRAALIADGGGIMFFPPGTTRMNTSAFELTDGVDWLGAGIWKSNVYFPTDAGAGTYALVHNTANGTNAPNIAGMRLTGPGSPAAMGVKPCEMSCLKIAYKTRMDNVYLFGWNRGVEVLGDHNIFSHVITEACFDGWYFGAGWLAKGDHSFYNCINGSNMRSGWLVTADNTLDGCAFHKCHTVGTPFGYLRPAAAASGTMIQNTIFFSPGFEQIGNSPIADLNTSGAASWLNNEVIGSGYSFQVAYQDAGQPRSYAINLPNSCIGGRIVQDANPFTVPTGGSGVFLLGTPSGNAFTSGVTIIDDQSSVDTPWLAFGPRTNTNYGHVIESPDGTRRARLVLAAGTIGAGDCLQFGADFNHVVRATTAYPVGTAEILPNNAATVTSGHYLLMREMTANIAPLCETVSAGGIALAQKTGAMHKLGLASDYTANPVVAISLAAGGNAGATTRIDARAVAGF